MKWYFSTARCHRRIERREVHLRPRRIGLGQELHADRVQRRRVVGADAVLGEALEDTCRAPAACRPRSSTGGSERCCAVERPKAVSRWFRSGRAKSQTCSRIGTSADQPSAFSVIVPRVVARLRVRRHVDQHPQRLVLAGRQVDRLVQAAAGRRASRRSRPVLSVGVWT